MRRFEAFFLKLLFYLIYLFFYRLTTLIVYIFSFLSMLAYTFTMKTKLEVVYVTASILGYTIFYLKSQKR